jgi:hypothetical protein
MFPFGDSNSILSGTRRSRVCKSKTTSVSHTEGEAPLPCPVPNRGSNSVPQ